MPAIPIEQLYPNFDTLSPIDQIAMIASGVQGYAKEIVNAMALAQTIAEANGIADMIATTAAGAGVGGSAVLTKERAAAIMLMQQFFLTAITTPLGESGLTPRMILYRKWPDPTPPSA